jgi:hypothetical protein
MDLPLFLRHWGVRKKEGGSFAFRTLMSRPALLGGGLIPFSDTLLTFGF